MIGSVVLFMCYGLRLANLVGRSLIINCNNKRVCISLPNAINLRHLFTYYTFYTQTPNKAVREFSLHIIISLIRADSCNSFASEA